MMEKIYKDVEFMEYPKEKRIYNSSVESIPVEQLLSILSNPYNEIFEDDEDDYFQGFEDGWDACLKAIKKELGYWEEENEMR